MNPKRANEDTGLVLAKDVTSHGFLPNPKTKQFDQTHFNVPRIKRRSSITVSEKLRIPRADALSTTLLAPSGARLTWMEMNGDNGSQ